MSKTKEFDRIAEECSELIIDKVFLVPRFRVSVEELLLRILY